MTCTGVTAQYPDLCLNGPTIAISDPCPQAYMNEASNSYVVLGLSNAPIDPYGACP